MDLTAIIKYVLRALSLLLFFTFFMPAASGCNNTSIYPYEVKSLSVYLPYFWGFFLFINLVMTKKENTWTGFAVNILYFMVSSFWFLTWGYILHREILSQNNVPSLDLIFPFFIWWLVLFILVKSRKIWSSYSIFFKRSVWTFGLLAVSFYLVFWIGPHLYGLTISFFVSIGLFITGLIFDFTDYLKKI